MKRITGVHHLAFATADLEGTIRFWRDLLGCRLLYGYALPCYRQYFFDLGGGDLISFFHWPRVERVPYKRHGEPVAGPFAFDHVSLRVENVEALWEIADVLAGAEFPVSDVIDHGFIQSIYAYDPNGIPIEFSCNVPGVDLNRHPPLLADPEPPPAAREGADPQAGHWPPPDPLDPEERVVLPGEGKAHFAKA